MKNYLFILIAIFFIGCAQKEVFIKTKTVKSKEIESKGDKIVKENDIFAQEEEVSDQSHVENKIAIIFPSKVVGKYATGAINVVTSKLLEKKEAFDIKVINIYDESEIGLDKAFQELRQKGYKNLILLITQNGLSGLQNSTYAKNFKIYLPLINRKNSLLTFKNVVYGGIDYKKQVAKLLEFSNGQNTMFSSQTSLGSKLQNIVKNQAFNIVLSDEIESNMTNFKQIVSQEVLNDSTLFLNTSIIKTSILLSQLRIYETTPYIMLSTQLNYDPLLISLTQYLDRKELLIANSIEKVKPNIEEISSLLDADLLYNWVNYSTLIGINYLLDEQPFIYNPIVNNQVEYRANIYKNGIYGFIQLSN